MKKLLLALLLFLPTTALAQPTVRFTADVYNDCSQTSQTACYDNHTKTIWISEFVDPKNLQYIFLHEYGHYLTLDYPQAELIKRFGNIKPYERAADEFYLFVKYPAFQTVDSIRFWSPLMMKN
jgi:hypothetical protein